MATEGDMHVPRIPGVNVPQSESEPISEGIEMTQKDRLRLEELFEWWEEDSRAAAEQTVPKAVEYSASDLAMIGEAMAATLGTVPPEGVEPEQWHTELACAWYALGKIGRWLGAIREGRAASDDTLFDLEIYAKMARRTREAGSWPGV